tara:strand:- start:24 stop:536 length:513 start_codon:yes stop_codon:yes gene_type:complete
MIYLVGFMGSGKTSIGKALSDRIKWEFIDTDKIIENKKGQSITSIFSEYGEEIFRKYELETLQEIQNKKKVIIATGGGLPINNNSIDIMNKTGITIYLKCTFNMLFKRLKKNKITRPIIRNLSNNELQKFIQQELNNREKYYKKAKYIIEIENLNTEDILSKINSLIFRR